MRAALRDDGSAVFGSARSRLAVWDVLSELAPYLNRPVFEIDISAKGGPGVRPGVSLS